MALRNALAPLRRAVCSTSCRMLSSNVDARVEVSSSASSSSNVESRLEALEQSENKPIGKHCGWGQTKIWDVLESKPEDTGAWLWCAKDEFVIDAVRKMTKGNVGSLLVFDPSKINLKNTDSMKSASSDAVVGIVTERDYLTKVVVLGKNSSALKVSEIMTPQSKLMTVSPDSSVLEVMALMVGNNFRHVPVVKDANYLGMVSIRDVVGVMYQEHREEVNRLHEYISGGY